jgi:hypothetical protein
MSATSAVVTTIAMRFIFAGCCAVAARIVGASIRAAMSSRRLIDRILMQPASWAQASEQQ